MFLFFGHLYVENNLCGQTAFEVKLYECELNVDDVYGLRAGDVCWSWCGLRVTSSLQP